MSRRRADALIAGGKVEINGCPAVLGDLVRPSDNVKLSGQSLRPVAAQTILLHKPAGYVCSRAGQGSRTIYELLPPKLHHLKPVGRLDKDSSGLLLLTNDGSLAQKLTHPSFQKEKIYEVELDEPLTEADFMRLTKAGVDIGDARLSLFKLAVCSKQSAASKQTQPSPCYWLPATCYWEARLSTGRNRQIRRSFAALGYEVVQLHRTQFGPYKLDQLPVGQHLTGPS